MLYYAGSPGRFVKKKISPGSVYASILGLVIICLGAGTITMPYAYYSLGYAVGTISIIFCGACSCFAGYLIAHCAHMTKGACFEEIAEMCYGRSGKIVTTVCMFFCNTGFSVSYIVLVSELNHLKHKIWQFKSFCPYALETVFSTTLPTWCGQKKLGQAFWCVLFSVSILTKIKLIDILCVSYFYPTLAKRPEI